MEPTIRIQAPSALDLERRIDQLTSGREASCEVQRGTLWSSTRPPTPVAVIRDRPV